VIVGLLGDVHCQVAALRAAIRYLRAERVEKILCVGDILDGPGEPNPTVALLRDNDVLTVTGNHDRWVIGDSMRDLVDATPRAKIDPAHLAWLGSLPETRDIQTPHGLALLCHGMGKNDMVGVRPDDEGYALETNSELTALVVQKKYRYVLNGHTHRRMVRTIDGLTIINAGTLHPGYEPVFTLVDFGAQIVRFFDAANPERIHLAEQVALTSGKPGPRP
jgi:predicted phosphodiesterase